MKTSHTPGPWTVEKDSRVGDDGESVIRILGALDNQTGGHLVAVVNRGWGDHEANARLIASVPDLLEVAHLSIRNEWIHSALSECAARERDKARASVEYIRINREEFASLREELKSNLRKIRAAIAKVEGAQ